MALTQEELAQVVEHLRTQSTDVQNLTEVTTLDGLTSLPAVRTNGAVVTAPLSLIQALAEEAAAAAAQSVVSAANEAAAAAEAAATKANTAATAAEAAALAITDAVIDGLKDSIQIGGTNLLKDTDGLLSAQNYTAYQGSSITYGEEAVAEFGSDTYGTVQASGGTAYTQAIKVLGNSNLVRKLVEGNIYTMSAWVKNLNSEGLIVVVNGLESALGNNTQPSTRVAAGEAKRVVLTGYCTSYLGQYLQFQLRATYQGGLVYAAVWRIQLEEGNMATAWSPAPEDIVAEAVSQITG